MSGELFELDPMADRQTRVLRVEQLRDRIRRGTYRVAAELVAEAMVRRLAEEPPERSSWQGPDADAQRRWS